MTCPNDTDGDGNCGRRYCPWCGPDALPLKIHMELNPGTSLTGAFGSILEDLQAGELEGQLRDPTNTQDLGWWVAVRGEWADEAPPPVSSVRDLPGYTDPRTDH